MFIMGGLAWMLVSGFKQRPPRARQLAAPPPPPPPYFHPHPHPPQPNLTHPPTPNQNLTHPILTPTHPPTPQVISPTLLRMNVWERGAGPTLACGTGACALTVAAILSGKTDQR